MAARIEHTDLERKRERDRERERETCTCFARSKESVSTRERVTNRLSFGLRDSCRCCFGRDLKFRFVSGRFKVFRYILVAERFRARRQTRNSFFFSFFFFFVRNAIINKNCNRVAFRNLTRNLNREIIKYRSLHLDSYFSRRNVFDYLMLSGYAITVLLFYVEKPEAPCKSHD